MSESKQDKWLYTFTLTKEVEVEKTEEQEINGEKVKVTKKIKEPRDVSFALKRPNRRTYEKADLFYGVQLSEGIRAGLLTKALLLKRYRNDGGALSDPDTNYFNELGSELANLENEHQRLLANLDNLPDTDKRTKIDEVVKKKLTILQSLQSLETLNQALFAHTAEAKAQVQLNNWWIVNLSFWDKENKGEYIEFFPGENFEQKMQQWDKFDETSDTITVEAVARFALLIGLWNSGAQSKEDFKQGEVEYASVSKTNASANTQQVVTPATGTSTNEVTGDKSS